MKGISSVNESELTAEFNGETSNVKVINNADSFNFNRCF